MSHTHHMMNALASDAKGFRMAWLMAKASFSHSMAYECGLWYSLCEAFRLFLDYVRK